MKTSLVSQLIVLNLCLFSFSVTCKADDNIEKPLLDQVKISLCEAVELALAKYPGTVVEVELDNEHGSLTYEIEILIDGREREVSVDCQTGAILEHEEE